jgi:hypothetical protein
MLKKKIVRRVLHEGKLIQRAPLPAAPAPQDQRDRANKQHTRPTTDNRQAKETPKIKEDRRSKIDHQSPTCSEVAESDRKNQPRYKLQYPPNVERPTTVTPWSTLGHKRKVDGRCMLWFDGLIDGCSERSDRVIIELFVQQLALLR